MGRFVASRLSVNVAGVVPEELTIPIHGTEAVAVQSLPAVAEVRSSVTRWSAWPRTVAASIFGWLTAMVATRKLNTWPLAPPELFTTSTRQ